MQKSLVNSLEKVVGWGKKSLEKVEVRFMKRTIGNKLNDYKHLKPPGSRQKMAEEVIRMEETTVTGIYCYPEYNFLITLYECNECGAVFLDRDDNYKYCPYCGREIVYGKEVKKC